MSDSVEQEEQVDDLIAEIRGAVARGWCWPKNERKVMDADLAFAIAEEVRRLMEQRLTEIALGIDKALLADRDYWRRRFRWFRYGVDRALVGQLKRRR